jgi:cytochrome c nitrite reductase small subunit
MRFFWGLASSIFLMAVAGFAFITGMGGVAFVEGQGLSYFSSDSQSCVNCHIMQDQYQSWLSSSHHDFTTCNTCHAPKNPVLALLYKAENGLNHSFKFTTGVHSDPIQIRPHNRKVALKACINCHSQIFQNSAHFEPDDSYNSCLDCHDNVGHPNSSRR